MNERIKKLRKALGLTQQEFADRIGGKRNTFASYETGRNEPSAAVLSLICREFHVREAWLRTGEGDMWQPDSGEFKNYLRQIETSEDVFIKEIILAYMKLEEMDKKALRRFIRMLSQNMEAEEAMGEKTDTKERSIEEKVAEYRCRLEEEKKAGGRSGASWHTA